MHSQTFQGAESLRAFLRFVVEKTVDGEANHLKEYTIATEVFGRNSNYDSRTDSFVRVQAGRLRTKLQEYYTTEGKQDKVVIDLPKGHYTPIFSHVEPSSGSSDVATVETSHPPATFLTNTSLTVNREPQQVNKRWQYAVIGLVALSLLLGSLSLTYFWEARNLKSQSGAKLPESTVAPSVFPIWDYILQSSEPIYVAFSNTRFEGTAETGMKLLKPLDSAASSGSFENRRNKYPDANSIITDHYTGIGEVMGSIILPTSFIASGDPFR